MRKADRLFQIVNLVRSHQPITAEKLAERLGVSVRTVYRYIDDLSLSNIPIYGETGVGYRLREGFELPPLTLTPEEMEALLLGVCGKDGGSQRRPAEGTEKLPWTIGASYIRAST